jgi:PAS domain S-box-containing protein
VTLELTGELQALLEQLVRSGAYESPEAAILAGLEQLRDAAEQAEMGSALRESERRLDLAVRSHGIGIFDWFIQTGEVRWSGQEERLFGLEPGAFPGAISEWAKAVHPDDLEAITRRLEEAMAAGAEAIDFHYRIIRADGEVRHIEGSGRFLYDRDGLPERMVGVNIDATERRRSEQALRDSEGRLRTIGDHLPFAMIYQTYVSADGTERRFLHVSKACERLNGITAEAALADPSKLFEILAPEERERVVKLNAEAIANQTPFDVEARFVLPDGTVRWFRMASAPRPADDGGTIWDGLQIDITDKKRAEEARALLMREVDHRARNALAIVQSIVQLTPAQDPATYKATVLGRVASLARAHGSLATQRWQGAELRSIFAGELESLAPASRFDLSGPPVELYPHQVQPLSMIVHELATNAVKHGALSVESGKVWVSWSVVSPGRVEISWRETGGPAAAEPARKGFGSRLIHQLSDQLDAQLVKTWGGEGLALTLQLDAACRQPVEDLAPMLAV